VEAQLDAAHDAVHPQAVAVAHAAGIFARRDIKPLLAGFNAPITADD